MKTAILLTLLALSACAEERPQSTRTPGLETGIVGNGGGGTGGESVVGRGNNAGVLNRVTVP